MNTPKFQILRWAATATLLSVTMLAALRCVAADTPLGGIPDSSAVSALGLFMDTEAPVGMRIPPQALRHRAARVDFRTLGLAKAKGALLKFNLFADTVFTGIVEAVDVRSEGDYTLIGRLQGEGFSSFVLVVNGDVMVMNLRQSKQGLLQVRYLGDGIHDLRQIDERLFPPCATSTAQAVPARAAGQPGTGTPKGDQQEDTGNVIDVMVVYTPAARAAVGGTAAMQALVNLAFTESNTAYEQSLITPRIRLVYQGEVTYTESGSFDTDLNRVTNPSDGYMDEVHTLRNTYGADLVSLWINDSSYCGIAWLMTSLSPSFEAQGFSVVYHGCATGYYSFSHEMGHNMGCAHDRENASGQGLYPYSYGWRFYGTDSIQYRTIMAYAPGTRIQRFSNPNVSYQGTATGVPLGDAKQSYNALTINNSAYAVANFRQTVSPSPVLHFASSALSGGNGDQSVDAGECNNLTVVVRNDGGSTASSISATLTSTTPSVAVVQPSSSYPNIAAGTTAANATAFAISTSPSFSCGTPVNLNLVLTYSGGSSTVPFTLASGGPNCAGAGIVYVDRSNQGPVANGAICTPFRTVTDGYQAGQNGNTIRIFSGNYPEALLNMNKQLVLQAVSGVVNIGRP